MRTSTSASKYFNLFFVLLVFSSASTSQTATTAINQLEGSTWASQIERPSYQAPQESNHRGSLLVDLGKIEEAAADASFAASTNSLQLVSPPLAKPAEWFNGKSQEADQIAAPSVTSVHQVWTSSSSGRMDELSPEVISKLRTGVPFLAAYALRPRIVGASEQQQPSAAAAGAGGDTLQPIDSYTTSSNPVQAPATNLETELNLQASSPHRSQSLISSFGAFNEFNVETLSTSKSEHRHRRKTVLKKDTGEDKLSQLKRSLSTRASSSIHKPKSFSKRRRVNSRSTSKAPRTRSSATANPPRRKKSRAKRGERRAKSSSFQKNQSVRSGGQRRGKAANSKSRMSIIRAGRYYQEQTVGGPANQPDDDGSASSVGTKSAGDQTTILVSGTKGGSDADAGGVKGGSNTADKRPFYSRAKPSVESSDGETAAQPDNALAGGNRAAADENDEGGELDDSPTPKRVGDDDIEEGGDTVTVMPKFDGVDDDPALPADGEEDSETNDQVPEGREGPTAGDGNQEGGTEAPERDEPRTKRINRERPNEDGVGSRGDGDGLAAGAGIGAATGGTDTDSGDRAVKTEPSRGGADDSGAADDSEEEDSQGRKVPEQPGVEFAKEAGGGMGGGSSAGAAAGGVAGSSTSSSGRGSSSDEDSENDQRQTVGDGSSSGRSNPDFDSARKGGADSTGGGAGATNADSGADMDVDYRDEMAEAERKTKSHGTGNQGDANEDGSRERAEPNAKGHEKGDCDDGSYNHFAHHGHHESTKWLRDAVPGEPGEDYPTLSRVNSTGFDCATKKLPGYYADVESRCQVFHICQADGRQDSFLCPNGTIFSQITSVCVLWNSFDCEDAPKYYHLNALLYKPSASKGGEANLRPLSRAREEEGSAIDSLLRAMRREQSSQADAVNMAGVTYDNANGARRKSIATNKDDDIGPDDEATIQRKSIDSLDGSSRLRSRAEPRRKRRAIVKNVPPKLHSRRISKLSRRTRTKLRLKPRRRA